jgi:hypothetical protein
MDSKEHFLLFLALHMVHKEQMISHNIIPLPQQQRQTQVKNYNISSIPSRLIPHPFQKEEEKNPF